MKKKIITVQSLLPSVPARSTNANEPDPTPKEEKALVWYHGKEKGKKKSFTKKSLHLTNQHADTEF